MIFMDIDGVLANFNLGADRILADRDIPHYSHPAEVPTWDWLTSVGKKEEDDLLWGRISDSDCYWLDLPSLISEESWGFLQLMNYKVVYLTNRRAGVDVYGQTYRWLLQHKIVEPKVLLVANKAQMLKQVGNVEVVVDDSPKNILSLAKRHTVYVPYYPYNSHTFSKAQHYPDSDTIIRSLYYGA